MRTLSRTQNCGSVFRPSVVWPVQGVIARILEFRSEACLVESYRQERKHSPPISSAHPSVFVLERERQLVPETLEAPAAERMCWKLGAPGGPLGLWPVTGKMILRSEAGDLVTSPICFLGSQLAPEVRPLGQVSLYPSVFRSPR